MTVLLLPAWTLMQTRRGVALCVLIALCAPSLSLPSTALCESSYHSALQHGDASSMSALEACALHYRSEQLLRALALAHARHPSAASAAKVQQLIALLPSDVVLLQAAAAIYMRSGHALWAALAMTRAALAVDTAGTATADSIVSGAAKQWDSLQRDRAAHKHVSAISGCCENQEPSRSCSKHFVDAPKFIGM